MNRSELIRQMVLSAMCDDFENVDQIILPVVARDCAKLGFSVERPEIAKTLGELVAEGMAKAYDLSGNNRDRFLENSRACHRSTSSRRTSKPTFTSRKR